MKPEEGPSGKRAMDPTTLVSNLQRLTAGQTVSLTSAELNKMSYEQLLQLAHGLGLSVAGLTDRNKLLTRLFDDVADEVEVEPSDT